MSFLNRFQPLALSGLLAMTATSCPPDRLWSSGRGESDDGPLACPVRDLPPDLNAFAARGIGPESFHLENLDRFQPLAGVCSPQQISRFDGVQRVITSRLASMPPAEIATTLEGYYRQAYVYNEADRTMDVGTSPAQQEAKRRLDLWIAAVDQRAFADRSFLDRIGAESRIRAAMALNSPRLSAYDRGVFEQMIRAEPRGDAGLLEVYRQRPLEGFTWVLDWMESYDGSSEKVFETPFMLSLLDTKVALEAHFGRERMFRIGREAFPAEGVERLLESRGYGIRYELARSLSNTELIQQYLETSMALTPESRPATRRDLVQDLMLMGLVFEERGLDPEQELQRRAIDQMVQNGFPRPEAELMYRLQAGGLTATYDRLDDYRARHGLLEEYRSLYRDMLTHPLEDVFSPQNRTRYAAWGSIVLNRSLSQVPIYLSDLDGIRLDVQRDIAPDFPLATGPLSFELRDRTTARWFLPSDLGLCNSLVLGPLMTAGSVSFQEQTANHLICSNVELMAFLPESLHQDHALATAIGVFGVITVRSQNVAVDPSGQAPRNAEWSTAALLDTLTHEASHVRWFRANFDRDPQRLTMAALNERTAYLTGEGYQTNYFLAGLASSGEGDAVADQTRFEARLVDVVNATVGIPKGNVDPSYWQPVWDMGPVSRFAFQPPEVLNARRFRQLMDTRFGPTTTATLDSAWRRFFEIAVARLPEEDRAEAREQLEDLEDPSNNSEAAVFFLRSDPLTRAVNEIRRAVGLQPLLSIDMISDDWTVARRRLTQDLLDRVRFESLPPSQRQLPRTQ